MLTFFRVLFIAPKTPLLQCEPKPIRATIKTAVILIRRGTWTAGPASLLVLPLSSETCNASMEAGRLGISTIGSVLTTASSVDENGFSVAIKAERSEVEQKYNGGHVLILSDPEHCPALGRTGQIFRIPVEISEIWTVPTVASCGSGGPKHCQLDRAIRLHGTKLPLDNVRGLSSNVFSGS